MATPTSSYLQTLPQDDAIAFVASLQKVKDHLSRELQWMKQQVQQKSIQLQGIETLLSEASMLGLLEASSASMGSMPTDTVTAAIAPLSSSGQVALAVDESANSPTATDADLVSETATSMSVPSTPNALVSESTPATAQTTQGSTALPGAKSAKSSGSNSWKPNPSRRVAKSTVAKSVKSSKSLKGKADSNRDMRELLLPKFADKSLRETVSEVLRTANKPLHLNEIVIEMYGLLPDDDFKRAKVSLMNVLSTGKKEGAWQNLGQGMYAANATPAT